MSAFHPLRTVTYEGILPPVDHVEGNRMSIVLILLIWAVTAVLLASRDMKRSWLAILIAYPVLCAGLFAFEPSFGPGGRAYLEVATVVAILIWAAVAVVSTIAWFVANRRRTAGS